MAWRFKGRWLASPQDEEEDGPKSQEKVHPLFAPTRERGELLAMNHVRG
jgi:hypothetical protein